MPRPSHTPLRSRFLAVRMRTFSPRGNLAKSSQNDEIRLALGHIDQRRLPEPSPHNKLLGIGLSACYLQSTNASTVSAPLWPRPLAKRLRTFLPRGNVATFSQKDEIRLALGHIGERRLAEAYPHDKLWCTDLSVCNLRLFP